MQAAKRVLLPERRKRGRPTKYRPEGVALVEEYLDECEDVYDAIHARLQVNLPTIEGFALKLGVHRDTLYTWAKRYPEYHSALGRIMAAQCNRLINEGLAGRYNAAMVVRMLRNNHGY